jgi:hypothetical protein
MAAFAELTRNEQAEAITRMAADGWTLDGISHATKLSREQIESVLTGQLEAVGA